MTSPIIHSFKNIKTMIIKLERFTKNIQTDVSFHAAALDNDIINAVIRTVIISLS